MSANASIFEPNSGFIQRKKRRICAIVPPAQQIGLESDRLLEAHQLISTAE
jgi:hypothetical protein